MRRLAALALLALAGCGDGPPSSVVPADASIYLGVDASAAERIVTGTSRDDIDFERDVRPWLGDRAAYFANEGGDAAGLVLATEDEEAAEAFGRKVTAAGPRFFLQVEDGRLFANFGERVGGVAEDLPDTDRYRDAARRLGGAPTLLIEREGGGYVAARRDGGKLTQVTRAG